MVKNQKAYPIIFNLIHYLTNGSITAIKACYQADAMAR